VASVPSTRVVYASCSAAGFPHRNRLGGYWIAEADPEAADELLTRSFPPEAVSWVVLATDGIQRHIDRLGGRWETVASQDSDQLAVFLQEAQTWETEEDPNGTAQPRSKRHDDKTIVVWRLELSPIN
jgi:hypothetical protein